MHTKRHSGPQKNAVDGLATCLQRLSDDPLILFPVVRFDGPVIHQNWLILRRPGVDVYRLNTRRAWLLVK